MLLKEWLNWSGQARGFAFVYLDLESDVEKVIEALNGKQLGDS